MRRPQFKTAVILPTGFRPPSNGIVVCFSITSATHTSGYDIIDVVNARPWITKDDLGVRIWDLRNIICQNPYRPHKETLDVEGELILRHINQYGRAPIGNKVEQKRLEKGLVPIKPNKTVAPGLMSTLFEEKKDE